jgi:hypothetical protein
MLLSDAQQMAALSAIVRPECGQHRRGLIDLLLIGTGQARVAGL